MSELIGELNSKIDNYEKIVRELQEENKRLNDILENIKGKMIIDPNDYEPPVMYKFRIDTAIEYIKKELKTDDYIEFVYGNEYMDKLIDILQGGNNGSKM